MFLIGHRMLEFRGDFRSRSINCHSRNDRDELEEAFIEMLHQKAVDKQMFLSVLKDHGIDADIQLLHYRTNLLNTADRIITVLLIPSTWIQVLEITYKGPEPVLTVV